MTSERAHLSFETFYGYLRGQMIALPLWELYPRRVFVESGELRTAPAWRGRGRTRPRTYEHVDRLNERLLDGCRELIGRYGLPGYTVGIRSKGCVTFSPVPVVDYETFKTHQDGELTELGWLYNMNRGIFATPGREEEWTLSVAHTDEAVERYVEVFDQRGQELTQRRGAASVAPSQAGF